MNNISVRWKYALVAGFCTLIAMCSLGATSYYYTKTTQQFVSKKTSENIKESTAQYVSSVAAEQAQRIKAVLDMNYQRANSVAQSVLFLRNSARDNHFTNEKMRNLLNIFLKQQTEFYSDVLGIYVVSEFDVFAGDDTTVKGREDIASNGAGRFAPYWTRNPDGSVELEVMAEEEILDTEADDFGVPYNEWYMCSVRTGQACVLNPYVDTVVSAGNQIDLLMTSVTVPVVDGGTVIAMVGIDISLDSLQPLIESVDNSLVSGKGEVALFS